MTPDAQGRFACVHRHGTKLSDMLTVSDKRYTAVMRLGLETDTQDLSGKVLYTKEVNVTAEEIKKAVSGFVGDVSQIPPMFSAVRVNGQKLYKLDGKALR